MAACRVGRLSAPGSGEDLGNAARKWRISPSHHFMARAPSNRFGKHVSKGHTGIDGLWRTMRGSALAGGNVPAPRLILPVPDRDGAKTMRLPFPADIGSVAPATGSLVRLKRPSARLTVIPMSKQAPVQEYLPRSRQARKRSIRSVSSRPSHSCRLAARASAMAVSWFQGQTGRLKGAPPTRSVMRG